MENESNLIKITNLGHISTIVSLNGQELHVGKHSSKMVPISLGNITIKALCEGTAYAYGIPEYWQKKSNTITLYNDGRLEYECICEFSIKKILFGFFIHINRIELTLRKL